MVLLGGLLLILGYVLYVPVLISLGWILAGIGAVLYVLGAIGRPVGGRSHYW